jgi:hypothetical protein
MFEIKTPTFYKAAGTALLLLLPLHASALSLGHKPDTVLLHIPSQDVDSFRAFIRQTLNESEAGQPKQWASSAKKGKQAVQVLLTPGASVQTQSAGQCRLLSADVSQSSKKENWKVWFCQQADGNWKISGLKTK